MAGGHLSCPSVPRFGLEERVAVRNVNDLKLSSFNTCICVLAVVVEKCLFILFYMIPEPSRNTCICSFEFSLLKDGPYRFARSLSPHGVASQTVPSCDASIGRVAGLVGRLMVILHGLS